MDPALKNPLEGEAVVLIDELELHLHPLWQGVLLGRLLEVFPHCQFIVTTHSPVVLGNVRPESIWVMPEEGEPYHPERSYGMDASELLDEIMGARSRNGEVSAELERIDRLINDEEFDSARLAIRALAEKTGRIPAIHAANSYLSMMGQEQADLEEE